MLYLVASCIALLFGPLCYRFFSQGSGLQKALDGFIFVSLGGLVLIHIMPELLEHGGWLTLVFVALGLWGPTASERVFHQYSHVTHNITLALGIGGLLLHTITDGSAMVLAQQDNYSIMLAIGVILHRLPVGLAIWWLLKPQVGSKWASLVIAAMMLLTAAGYFGSEQVLDQLSLENTALLQAFVTGSILHVVLHQPHVEHDQQQTDKYQYHAGVGSLLGLGLLAIMLHFDAGCSASGDVHDHSHHHGHDHAQGFEQLLDWLLLVAPYLVLAYLGAALRFKFDLKPDSHHLFAQWLQRLIGPEALIISLMLLGPVYGVIHLLVALALSLLLSKQVIAVTDPHSQLPSSPWQFGFSHIVDRSAPWVIFSLVVAHVIGHPSMPFANPYIQLAILFAVFLPLRFCNLGAAILAVALALSGWSAAAVVFVLIAAPLINLAQFKLMSALQIAMSIACIMVAVAAINAIGLPQASQYSLPSWLNGISLAIIALLFSASLLRVGPRKFLARLMLSRPHAHHH
ncbi:metal transporter [Shewanella maritima]|uniref:Metal transporter n=1 Tax=Shewanella maritima TaxID=2520507 RepID=A0A411PH83_9GAMM|nr:metal transporter [Shewanella maritima]QBF82957.1 metal transporter [Shewanella maritima]